MARSAVSRFCTSGLSPEFVTALVRQTLFGGIHLARQHPKPVTEMIHGHAARHDRTQ